MLLQVYVDAASTPDAVSCVGVFVYIYVRVYIHFHIYACVYMSLHIYARVYTYMHICTYMCAGCCARSACV